MFAISQCFFFTRNVELKTASTMTWIQLIYTNFKLLNRWKKPTPNLFHLFMQNNAFECTDNTYLSKLIMLTWFILINTVEPFVSVVSVDFAQIDLSMIIFNVITYVSLLHWCDKQNWLKFYIYLRSLAFKTFCNQVRLHPITIPQGYLLHVNSMNTFKCYLIKLSTMRF